VLVIMVSGNKTSVTILVPILVILDQA